MQVTCIIMAFIKLIVHGFEIFLHGTRDSRCGRYSGMLYDVCTSIPVVLQSFVHLVRAITNLKRYKVYSSSVQGEVITREDYYLAR